MIIEQEVNVKKSFKETIAESDLYPMYYELGYTKAEIDAFMGRRIRDLLIIVTAALIAGILWRFELIFVGVLLAGYLWYDSYQRVRRSYGHYLFLRELDFWRFIRMVIPFLTTKQPLFEIFEEQLVILESNISEARKQEKSYIHGSVASNLKRLMVDMVNESGQVSNFSKFAESCSNSDRAVLIMTAIHDKTEYSDDASVVLELGEIASRELFKQVDQAILIKTTRLNSPPTVITMSSLLFVVSYAVSSFASLFTVL